ncbi:rRNA methyltransferase 3B, mitochondrial [Brachyhypopomus gauderio]|uniref:rRNA methyltransferase 3B, mitochondrial n=1 Tax=Brachyhypopomus gauderio TaxID=698409 RepID=UPI004042EA1B
MATLMRRMGGVYKILEPTVKVRNSIRYARVVRRRPLAVGSELNSSKLAVQDVHAQCEDVLENGLSPAQGCTSKDRVMETDKIVRQKHGDTTPVASVQISESPHHITASKEISRVSHSISSGLKEVDGLWYEKARPGDKSLSRLGNLARSKKLREQQGKVLLEGPRLICDALDAGGLLQTVFFSTVETLRELPMHKLTQASLINVKPEDIRISGLDSPFDVVAVFRRPEVSRMHFPEEKRGKALPLTLICDNMRDPGNLGVVLRCAVAAGCHSVLLTKGCVDVWETKVLRAAMGAHFCLPIIPNLTWVDIHSHLPAATTVHVADNCRDTIKRQQLSATPENPKKHGDYGWISKHRNHRKMCNEDEDFNEDQYEEDRCSQTGPALETQPYHISWTGRHTAIVIGGETHGLSQEALQLAEKTEGRRLVIPMVRGVNSLNSAMAASVLLFEGRRQLQLQACE